ncbi:MAG: ribonuclease III [Flavobacteriaceae bacterium]|nr:ribonuclease III [Flavobacteriaceae bacterium]
MNFFRKKLKPNAHEDNRFYKGLTEILGFKPKSLPLYRKAFTHSSVKQINKEGKPLNYERLEFLGDAIIGTVIAEYLFIKAPLEDEGYLTQMRSKIVSRKHLNNVGKNLNLIQFVKSTVKESRFGENIHGNVFEALTGAIFIDKGFIVCSNFLHQKLIGPYIDLNALEQQISSYKSLLIEWCQKEKKEFKFDIYEDSGNDDIRHYSVKLFIDGKQVAKGRDTSKKKAEEKTAQRGYYALQNKIT